MLRLTGDQYKQIIPATFNIPIYGTPQYGKFEINAVQEYLLDGLYDRNIVAKSRKHGTSVLIESIAVTNCNEFENYHAGFLANSDSNTLGIFNKTVDLLEKANYKFDAVPLKSSIQFGNGSWIKVATAGAKAAFRGDDLHMLHLSENAFFEHPDIYDATMEAGQHLFCFIESTSNGRNHFYDLWERAQGFPKECDFKPFFFPWFRHPDNIKEVPEDFELTSEEKELKSEHNLEDEQIAWWRWKPTAMANPEKFPQEHPSTAEESFISSGKPVFNQTMLVRQKNRDVNYNIGAIELGKDFELKFFNQEKGVAGDIRLFHRPIQGHQYIIGGDAAWGLRGGDANTLYVEDVITKEQSAEFWSKCDPDQFAYKANQIGRYYNNALMAIERNGPGRTVNSILYNKYEYPRIWQEEVEDEAMITNVTEKLGFNTNKASKFALIDLGKRAIRLGLRKINSVPCLNELLAYEYDATGKKANAPKGKKDDRVIAFLITNYIAEHYAQEQFKYYPERSDSSAYFDLIEKPARSVSHDVRGSGY